MEQNEFETLFNNSMAKMDRLSPGQMVETTIVSISGDNVFLDLGGKSEGILDIAELKDKDGDIHVNEGDTIKAFFLSARNGEMRFTTRISGDSANMDLLENAFKNGIPVEGVVEKEIKGGFEVRVGGTRAFCPYSHMGERRVEDSSVYVGKHLSFKILELSENGRKFLVSNRAILEEERQVQIEALKQTLAEGQVVEGTVKSLQAFGAFVDVQGFQALLPISEISRERIEDVSQVLSVGQTVSAQILRIDWKAERLTLSLKALLADPWTDAARRYPVGSKHQGTVSRLAPFGAFVTLESGLDGLLHESETRGDDAFGNQRKAVKSGEKLTVVIKAVDAAQHRISLGLGDSVEADAATKAYMAGNDAGNGDTYNPFAQLLKGKK